MRSIEKIPSIPAIKTGLVDLCDFLLLAFSKTEAVIYDRIMYELGSFAGESAEIFANYFQAVHCVDPWIDPCGAPSIELVEQSFNERATIAGNMIKHKMGSVEAAAGVPDVSLDFVYIDAGTHSYAECKRDIEAWYAKVKPGGFIGGHDFEIPELHAHDTFPGVQRAVKEFFGDLEARTFPDTSWLVRKP
jgi:hypothetical protein